MDLRGKKELRYTCIGEILIDASRMGYLQSTEKVRKNTQKNVKSGPNSTYHMRTVRKSCATIALFICNSLVNRPLKDSVRSWKAQNMRLRLKKN